MASVQLSLQTACPAQPRHRCQGIGAVLAMLLASLMALLVCVSSGFAAEVDSNKYALALRVAGDQLDELKILRDQLTRYRDATRRLSSDITERAKRIQSLNGEFRQKVAEAKAISDKNAEYWQALDGYEAGAMAAEDEAASLEREAQQLCSSAGGANGADSDSVARVKQHAAAVTQSIPPPLPFKLMEQTVKARSAAFEQSLRQAMELEIKAQQELNGIEQGLLKLELLERDFSMAQRRAEDLRVQLVQAAGQLPAAEFRALVAAKNFRMMIEGGTVDPLRLALPPSEHTPAYELGLVAKQTCQEQKDAISGSLGNGESPERLLHRLKDVKDRFEAISKRVNAAVTSAGSCKPLSDPAAAQGSPCDKGKGCPQGTQCGPQNTCVPSQPAGGLQEVQFERVAFDAAEEAGEAVVMVKRTGGTTGELTVRYRTVDPKDKTSKYYRAATGTVTWGDGDSKAKPVRVPIINDTVYIGSRSYTIELFDPQNRAAAVRLGNQWQAMIYIIEDDLPPEPIVPPLPPPRCSYLIIQPQNVEVAPNRSVTFTATAVFDKGGRRDVTLLATWQATAGTAAQVSPRQTWLLSPGSTYTAPGNLRDNQNVTITATWDGCEGTTTLNALAPSWTPPMSSAANLGTRGETPGPLEFRHYVLCDRTGHVVTGTSYNPVDFGWMAGPIGARHAEQWIERNCPRGLCIKEGGQGVCAKEPPLAPTDGDAYYALCDKTGHVVISRSAYLTSHGIMSPALTGEAGARWWIEQNCPKWLCTIEGSRGICAKEPPLAPTDGDAYYALCDKTGHVVISRSANFSGHVQLSPYALTGEAGARWWIENNCPSWACTSSGGCASVGQIRTGGKWAVVCSKRNGSVVLTEYPNIVDSWVWAEHLLTDGDAKNWIAKNCPSEHCDQNGRCLPGAAPQGRPVEVPAGAALEMFGQRESSRQTGGRSGFGIYLGQGGRFSTDTLRQQMDRDSQMQAATGDSGGSSSSGEQHCQTDASCAAGYRCQGGHCVPGAAGSGLPAGAATSPGTSGGMGAAAVAPVKPATTTTTGAGGTKPPTVPAGKVETKSGSLDPDLLRQKVALKKKEGYIATFISSPVNLVLSQEGRATITTQNVVFEGSLRTASGVHFNRMTYTLYDGSGVKYLGGKLAWTTEFSWTGTKPNDKQAQKYPPGEGTWRAVQQNDGSYLLYLPNGSPPLWGDIPYRLR